MKQLLNEMIKCMDEGKNSVLCTVVASSGSVPRSAGARMLVTDAGRACGTIGGGAVEHKALDLASEVLASGRSAEKAFDLSCGDIEGLGMICGGRVQVFFQYIPPDDNITKAVLSKCLREIDINNNAWLVTDISDETSWGLGLICNDGIYGLGIPAGSLGRLACARAVRVEINGRQYYSEPVSRAGRVIVFGGGHVAQELVPVLSHLGFYCVVVDDRAEFASDRLFASAERVIAGDFSNISGYLDIGRDDYIVIMTRGHAHDYTVAEQVLKTKAGYIGKIGSRKKIEAASEKLLEAGIPQQRIDSMYAPIGLEIKAETPAEIAISVAGELIRVRAERCENA